MVREGRERRGGEEKRREKCVGKGKKEKVRKWEALRGKEKKGKERKGKEKKGDSK